MICITESVLQNTRLTVKLKLMITDELKRIIFLDPWLLILICISSFEILSIIITLSFNKTDKPVFIVLIFVICIGALFTLVPTITLLIVVFSFGLIIPIIYPIALAMPYLLLICILHFFLRNSTLNRYQLISIYLLSIFTLGVTPSLYDKYISGNYPEKQKYGSIAMPFIVYPYISFTSGNEPRIYREERDFH